MSKPLPHSPADVTKWALIALGLGTDPTTNQAWPVFAAGEAATPDECLTVYDTTPKLDGRSHIDGEESMHWGFQIRIRGRQYQNSAWPKTEAIRVKLNESVNQMVVTVPANPNGPPQASYAVQAFSKVQPLSLGRETPSSRRNLFTINGFLTVRAL